ncbi:HAMP domain-containing sensor histidine kinase [Actinoplanes sp. TFC3]|uniref:HAMP domain-containing sensor histidine kinase n=1 Tax=Actinoplanes sp. TFC3 TaxID=1710355 RepID=UPI000830440E|nr:HAMP domain-containing sensor histidine kinase [Actinoplanes sp. TFC3]
MRRRLTLLVAATTCLVLLAFLVPLALLLPQVAADRAVGRATGVLQTIVPLIGSNSDDDVALSVQGQPVPVSVFAPGGAVLGAPAEPTPAVRLSIATLRSLSVQTGAGREIVVPVSSRQGTYAIRTVVPAAELNAGVTRSWLALAGLGVALVLLGLLVADRLALTLVAPITALSAVSHRLALAELSARAAPEGPPEVQEVAAALNHLAGRIQDLLREEREQVADLSHRLRTPLTALRLEVESLSIPGEAERVAAAADSIERAVTTVIQQARRRGGEKQTCDATAVVRDRVAFWSVLAEDTDRQVRSELPAVPLPVSIPEDELAAALDALLGNVFAHTPDGTAFGVRLRARPGGPGAILEVSDAGPGFPAEALHRGTSGAGSTGLGLDIARRAAETSGGSLRVETGPDGGALVRLELP